MILKVAFIIIQIRKLPLLNHIILQEAKGNGIKWSMSELYVR